MPCAASFSKTAQNWNKIKTTQNWVKVRNHIMSGQLKTTEKRVYIFL